MSKPVKIKSFPRNERQAKAALSLFRGKRTTEELAKLTGSHTRTVSNWLSWLRDRGLVGNATSWTYRPGKYSVWYAVNPKQWRREIVPAAELVLSGLKKHADGKGRKPRERKALRGRIAV